MIRLNSIEKRKYINSVLDIISPIYLPNNPIRVLDEVVVSKQEEGALWIYARKYYADENLVDLIAIFNGIDDILSVQEGQKIMIPDPNDMLSNNFIDTDDDTQNIVVEFFRKKFTQTDIKRIEQLKKRLNSDNEVVGPGNIATSPQKTPSGGRIFFNSNSVKRKNNEIREETRSIVEQFISNTPTELL